MNWNWQLPDWPRFTWSHSRLAKAEERFLLGAGTLFGTVRHLIDDDRDHLIVEAMSDEALTTSQIEGEYLDRASVRSSIRRQLGLSDDLRRVRPAEKGIGEVMVDLYRNHQQALTHEILFAWHRMITAGRDDLHDIGRYRTHVEPMRVVSGRHGDPHVHFEAPPSGRVPEEMSRFIDWFTHTSPGGTEPLPPLTRAGISHLFFESIHPFEDGNGRVGRAIAEKALSQSLRRPSLTALAVTILAHQREYYFALEAANKSNDISTWLAWFAAVGLEAQHRAIAQVEFIIDKTKLLDRCRAQLNARQSAVLLRVLREGPTGFKGGLSAGNYVSIAKTSSASATRDLAKLVELGAFTRTGEKRHARYHPTIPIRTTPRINIDINGTIIQSPASTN